MPSSRETTVRLTHIEEILAQTAPSPTAAAVTTDAATVHLNSVPIDRLRRLTAELGDTPPAEGPDVVDAVVMRLLLDEFATAVTHLRAVARAAASRVDAAAPPLRDARRALHRLEKSTTTHAENWMNKR